MLWVSKDALILLLFGITGSSEKSPSEKVLVMWDPKHIQLQCQHQHGMPLTSPTNNWQGEVSTNVHSSGHEVQWRPSIKLQRTIWWQSWRMPTFWPSMQDVLQSSRGIYNSQDVYGVKRTGTSKGTHNLHGWLEGVYCSLIWTFLLHVFSLLLFVCTL